MHRSFGEFNALHHQSTSGGAAHGMAWHPSAHISPATATRPSLQEEIYSSSYAAAAYLESISFEKKVSSREDSKPPLLFRRKDSKPPYSANPVGEMPLFTRT